MIVRPEEAHESEEAHGRSERIDVPDVAAEKLVIDDHAEEATPPKNEDKIASIENPPLPKPTRKFMHDPKRLSACAP